MFLWMQFAAFQGNFLLNSHSCSISGAHKYWNFVSHPVDCYHFIQLLFIHFHFFLQLNFYWLLYLLLWSQCIFVRRLRKYSIANYSLFAPIRYGDNFMSFRQKFIESWFMAEITHFIRVIFSMVSKKEKCCGGHNFGFKKCIGQEIQIGQIHAKKTNLIGQFAIFAISSSFAFISQHHSILSQQAMFINIAKRFCFCLCFSLDFILFSTCNNIFI